MTVHRCQRFNVLAAILLLVTFTWSTVGHAAPGRAGVEALLGEAPQRHESQDTSGWIDLRARKVQSAPGTMAVDGAAARTKVVELYKSVYVPGDAAVLDWSGAIATCDPGFTNVEHQRAVIDRVNYARALVGLPGVALSGSPPTTQAQAASLIMAANNALSHFPPASWRCFSTEGASGAANSNLALGASGVDAIDLYLDDPGAGNSAVGHRRWLLFPPRAAMATGDVPRNGPTNPAANDLYVFGATTTRPATPSGVAWPPAGFVPYQNLPAMSNRWSFSYPGANFSAASVVMTGPGGAVPVTLEPVATGYGDNTVVFLPAGFSYGKPAADTTYAVTIRGMTGNGVPASLEYTVTVIDPEAAAPASLNFQGLWYNAPAESESGWGINLAHQGDVIFATWFTYDATGRAWWLSMTADRKAENVYAGTLYQTFGPPFGADPFNPLLVARTPVGAGTLTFASAGSGTFAYSAGGVSGIKSIVRQQFGQLPTCMWGEPSDRSAATNYQDLWWASPPESESGWGVNLTHQGDTIFATWFTYDFDGLPLWLSATTPKTGTGVYAGPLYRTTGPPFNADPFDPGAVTRTPVGSLTLSFVDGNSASFAYTVTLPGSPPVARTKPITRQVFRPPGTTCR